MLKIGEFSRLARVTVKTLRHYDRTGLFRPAYVAPGSGYRYYRVDQLPLLQKVRMLRELGCSVRQAGQISSLPVDSAQYAEHLAQLRRGLMVRVARAEQRLRQLDAVRRDRRGGARQAGSMLVSERPIETVCALTVRDRVRSLGTSVARMFEATEQLAARHGVRAPSSPFLLFHDIDYREVDVDVEVCVPVTDDGAPACGARWIAGAPRAACLRFGGAYEQAPSLYRSALDWMDAAGMRLAGPVREVYLRFGADQDGYELPPQMLANGPLEYDTELQIPITSA